MGGAALLDVRLHMVARRWALFQDMCLQKQPWAFMARDLIELEGLSHGRTRVQASWWDIVNAAHPVRIRSSHILSHILLS